MIVLVALGAVLFTSGEYPIAAFLALTVIFLSLLLVLKRFGLLVLVIGLVVQSLLLILPTTTHLAQWFAAPSLVGLFAIAALAIYGFYAALAGQPVFQSSVLDE